MYEKNNKNNRTDFISVLFFAIFWGLQKMVFFNYYHFPLSQFVYFMRQFSEKQKKEDGEENSLKRE